MDVESLAVIKDLGDRNKELMAENQALVREREANEREHAALKAEIEKLKEMHRVLNQRAAQQAKNPTGTTQMIETLSSRVRDLTSVIRKLLTNHDGCEYKTEDCSSSWCCASHGEAIEEAEKLLASPDAEKDSTLGREG